MRALLKSTCLALSLAPLVSLSPVAAATLTTTFDVTANIAVTCAISANDLSFGAYDRAAAAALQVQSNVLVNCTNGAAFDIALDKGLHGATVTARKMANNSDSSVLLNYQLFSDPAHTINWGETIGTDTVDGTGTGVIQNVGVYGQIPAHQSTATAGGYSDTITATLTF